MKKYLQLTAMSIDDRLDFLEKEYEKHPRDIAKRLMALNNQNYFEYAPGQYVVIVRY